MWFVFLICSMVSDILDQLWTFRMARAFNMSGASCVLSRNVLKAFDMILDASILYKLHSWGIIDQFFSLFFISQ